MRSLLDLVAPPVCLACGATSDGELCGPCAGSIAVIEEPICSRCGAPGQAGCGCDDVGGFRRARSIVAFAEPARSLTLSLKRRGRTSTADAMGRLVGAMVRRCGLAQGAGEVTFVPAGPKAAAQGFDHAELIARAAAAELDLPVRRRLRRVNDGPRQADVGLNERRANVAGRFGAGRVRGGVLLVDDVYTTGATAEACASALVASGASWVDVATWARTLRRRAA